MYHRSFSLLAVISLAFAIGGCESLWTSSANQTKKKKQHQEKNYEEILMPLQTGSVLLAILVTLYWAKRKTTVQLDAKPIG